MGNTAPSLLTAQDLQSFEETTFFTKAEVKKVFALFTKLTASKPGPSPLKKTLTAQEFMKLPHLAHNPYKERIARIYTKNEKQAVGFEEFLDFLSVFSGEATRDVKAFYAFKIYDYDEDGYIGKEDIKKAVIALVGKELTEKEVATIGDKILEEVDIDGDGRLSFVEFEHVINRSSNFDKYSHGLAVCILP